MTETLGGAESIMKARVRRRAERTSACHSSGELGGFLCRREGYRLRPAESPRQTLGQRNGGSPAQVAFRLRAVPGDRGEPVTYPIARRRRLFAAHRCDELRQQ